MWPVAVIVDEADAFLATATPRGQRHQRARISRRSPRSWGTRSSGERSSGSCSPPGPTCCRWTSSGRARGGAPGALLSGVHEERVELVKTMARKAKVNFGGRHHRHPAPRPAQDVGADIEAALVRAKLRAVTDRRDRVTAQDPARDLRGLPPTELSAGGRAADAGGRSRNAPRARCCPNRTGRCLATRSRSASAS